MLEDDATTPDAENRRLADAGKLLILLYTRAIEGFHAAAEAAEAGRVMDRLEATVRSAEAVCQLHLGLDLERGGTIAANLDQLYRFIQAQIPTVNLHNDAGLARRLAGLLEPLLESWTEVVSEVAAPASLGVPGVPKHAAGAPAGAAAL